MIMNKYGILHSFINLVIMSLGKNRQWGLVFRKMVNF